MAEIKNILRVRKLVSNLRKLVFQVIGKNANLYIYSKVDDPNQVYSIGDISIVQFGKRKIVQIESENLTDSC